jgi:hypothetical protein
LLGPPKFQFKKPNYYTKEEQKITSEQPYFKKGRSLEKLLGNTLVSK